MSKSEANLVLSLTGQSLIHVLSYLWATLVHSPRNKILVCRRLTLGYGLPIVFFCLALGYPWATFVCSPRVAQGPHFVDSHLVKQEEKCLKMSKSWANLVLGLKSQSLLHVLSYPWATLVLSPRYKILVCRRLTLGYGLPIVFFCFALGYPWATFLCSPRVAQGRHFLDRYLVKEEVKCLKMSYSWANLVLGLKSQSLLHALSYPWATIVRSPRYKILVCRRLTLGYALPIVFFCLALDYPWATFVCSPRVAQGRHFLDRYLVKQEEKCLKMSKSWANLVLGLKSQSLLHALSYPWATIVRSPRCKILVGRRLTLGYGLPIVFFCLALGYPWATFVCSPRVAQGRHFLDRYLVKQEEKCLKMSKSEANLVLGLKDQSLFHVLSYPWAALVGSPRYKILVSRRLTLGYGLPIVFFCFALGYPWASFVCSPREAQGRHFLDRYPVKQEKMFKNV